MKSLKLIKNLLFAGVLLLGIVRIYLGAVPTLASDIDSASLMVKINQERINRQIPSLSTSEKLNSAATAKTADMLDRGYFDHIDPDGRYVWFRVEAAGYKPYKILGENLALDFSTEEGIIRAWINSPSHRDNMLRADFSDQGLSSQYGNYQNRYTNAVTSLFGTLISPAPPPAPQIEAPPTTTTTSHPTTTTTKKPFIPPSSTFTPTTQSPETDTTNVYSGTSEDQNNDTSNRQPAILITPSPEFGTTSNQQTDFTATTPHPEGNIDQKLYEIIRIVFMFLAIAFIAVSGLDNLLNKRSKSLWTNELHLPVLVLLIMTGILTIGIY